MSDTTTKEWRIHLSHNLPTMDALGGSLKNRAKEAAILMRDNAPYEYRLFEFYGEETPTNTNYPDSVAPIGSIFHKLSMTSGAVSGYQQYHKVAAATWEAVTTA